MRTSRSTSLPRGCATRACVRKRPIRPTSRRSSTPRSGPACGAKRATSRRSRWRCCRRSMALHPLRSSGRCRSTRPRSSRWRRPSSAPGIHLGVWRERRASCGCGARRGRSRPSASCSKSRRRTARRQASPRRGRKVRQRRRARGRAGQDHRRAGVEAARLPGAADVAARLRRHDERSETARRTCSCSSPCRCGRTAAAASLLVVPPDSDSWRRIDRAAGLVRRRAGVFGAGRSCGTSRRSAWPVKPEPEDDDRASGRTRSSDTVERLPA